MMVPHAVIRADASVAIGTGHVVRCRTLAQALIARGWRVTVATRDLAEGLARGLERAGIRIFPIANDSPIGNEPVAIARNVGAGPTLVVADHYGLDTTWFASMRRLAPTAILMAIDDLADRPLPVDLVLNQNLGATPDAYEGLVAEPARVLVGSTFALIRPEFAELRARGRARDGRVDRLLVFMSGADPADVTARAIAGVRHLGRPIDVVVGATYPHQATLRAAIASNPAIAMHVDSDHVAALMERADLAIGAAGSASWERCALGLPAVIVTMADNQLDVGRHLVEAGAAISLGWHASVVPSDFERAIRVLCADPSRVVAMSSAAAAVTDGRGTERVVAEIEAVVSRRV